MRRETVNFIKHMSLKHSGRNLVFGEIGEVFMELMKFKLIFEKFKKIIGEVVIFVKIIL